MARAPASGRGPGEGRPLGRGDDPPGHVPRLVLRRPPPRQRRGPVPIPESLAPPLRDSQRERDILEVMQPVLDGKRTQVEAARLLKRSVRQVRRIQRKLEQHGDTAIVHGLRGTPSNHQHNATFKAQVLNAYRKKLCRLQTCLRCENSPRSKGGKWVSKHFDDGFFKPDSGNGVVNAARTAAGARDAVALASWFRWTPRSTTGSKDVTKTSFSSP